MTDNLLAQSFEAMLQQHCTPAQVRAIEVGESSAGLWQEFEQSGFLDALVDEEQGGAGLTLPDIFPLLVLCGRYAVPVAVGETMLARAALASAGQERGQDELLLEATPFADHDSRRFAGAAIIAAHMAGAMDRAFELTVQFANDRSQFGRPIGKFQAVQQMVSVMAEQTFAAKMAAETGCQATGWMPDAMRAALAKSRTSEAAVQVCANAHAVHGAIGATEEYDLQLFTRRLHEWRRAYGSESYWNRFIGEAILKSDNNRIVDDIRHNLSV